MRDIKINCAKVVYMRIARRTYEYLEIEPYWEVILDLTKIKDLS